ncbi:MAG: ferritin [Heliobacteriaceae bacterium]|jgi:ferritin|nr:ferritin [Heliobacteriaceae bacterium]
MISQKMGNAINDQINAELFSEYLYLSMQAYFQRINLLGFANWMDVQVKEERAHGMGLFNHLIERGGKVELLAIDKPKTDWSSALEVFEAALEHEQFVTGRINSLVTVAEEEKDRASISFLDWYVKEQVEEEFNANSIIQSLKLIGPDANALLLLDKDLAARTFVAPVIA